jgi:hypothetical protein
MRIRRCVRAFTALLCLGAVLLAASCATSRGSTLGQVVSTQGTSATGQKSSGNPPQEPAQNPPGSSKGLQVLSDPSSAEVWIDGDYKGLSPFVWEDISVGWHRVVLRKEGYYESSGWVEFKGDPVLYQTSLAEIIGFLQVTGTPTNITVSVDGEDIPQGTQQVRVGSHDVTVKSFGYTPYTASVVIAEKTVTTLSVALQPAPFDVTSFALPKSSVNPANPGLLGELEAGFSVTGPGAGEIHVLDATGDDVFTRALPAFTTWDQSFTWDVHTGTGQALTDGTYTMRLVAKGPGDAPPVTRESAFTVDSSMRISQRSVWSGSSGLLYAPVADILPVGDFQLGVLGAGLSDPTYGIEAPIQLGMRVGVSPGLEVDASAGLIGTSTVLPIFGSISARWGILPLRGGTGTSAAVQVKLAGQVSTSQDSAGPLMTDTFANFSGLSVELPLQLTVGALSGLLSFGATGSFWYPYLFQADGVTPKFGPFAWLYIRAGILLDLGSVTAGVSASTRTQQLPGGISLLSTPIPFEAGAEIHWLLPRTRLVLTGIFAGEYKDANNYFFMGGGGLGFLY